MPDTPDCTNLGGEVWPSTKQWEILSDSQIAPPRSSPLQLLLCMKKKIRLFLLQVFKYLILQQTHLTMGVYGYIQLCLIFELNKFLESVSPTVGLTFFPLLFSFPSPSLPSPHFSLLFSRYSISKLNGSCPEQRKSEDLFSFLHFKFMPPLR